MIFLEIVHIFIKLFELFIFRIKWQKSLISNFVYSPFFAVAEILFLGFRFKILMSENKSSTVAVLTVHAKFTDQLPFLI